MTITNEIKLRDFHFWGGAVERANKLTPEELDSIEDMISYDNESWSSTEVNDYIWFEEETYVPLLGISAEEWEAR